MINEQAIICPVENGERFVAITPVCKILGINPETQKRVIKEHPIYNSTHVLNTGVATDNKEREMLFINFKHFFGWLFGIHPNKVKEDNRENLIKYQAEVCNILYEKFFMEPQFLKLKTEAKLKIINEIENVNTDLKEKRKKLKEIDGYTYADFKASSMQLSLFD